MKRVLLSNSILAMGMMVVGSAAPAWAGCTTTGNVNISNPPGACGADGVYGWAESGPASLHVSDITVEGGNADYGLISLRVANPLTGIDLSLTVDGQTIVNSTGAQGVMARTEADGDIDITIGSTVTVNSNGAGVTGWNVNGGSITIVNDGTVHAGLTDDYTSHGSDAGSEGIDATANGIGSSVSITNNGQVTSTFGRGIYADGGSGAEDPVAVTIDNQGSIDAWLAGARAIDYLGTATVINGVDGVILSHNRQGVVAWSADGDAVAVNHGSVTSENGSAIVVWGSDSATIDNYGSIVSGQTIGRVTTQTHFYGIDGYTQVEGATVITNHAGATISATADDGIFGRNESGSVAIVNDGSVWAAGAGLHAQTAGGAVTISNSGLVAADGEGGAIDVDGAGLTTVEVSNAASGLVAAASQLETYAAPGHLADLSAPEQEIFASAVSGTAVNISASAGSATVENAGTLLGNIRIALGGDIPEIGAATIENAGLWAFSGESGFGAAVETSSLANTGTIWSLGDSVLDSALDNDGALYVTSLGDTAGRLTITGDYAGGTASTFVFDTASLSATAGDAVLTIEGDVTGVTKVSLADPSALSGLDWDQLPRGTVVQAEGSNNAGASSFTMRQNYGLLTLGLDYAAGDQSWHLAYDTDAAGQTLSRLNQAGRYLLESQFDAAEDRLAWLRADRPKAAAAVPATAYAEPDRPADPAAQAIAASNQPVYAAWARTVGAYGDGDGYLRRSGAIEGGLDGRFSLDGGRDLVLGLFASYGATRLSFTDGDRETLAGPGVGAYAGLSFANGAFVDTTLAWQQLDTDIDLSGLSTSQDGSSVGGRITVGRRMTQGSYELTPVAAISASLTRFDGFTMQDLGVGFENSAAFTAEAGFDVARTWSTALGELKPFAGWRVGDRVLSGGDVSISDIANYADVSDGVFGRLDIGAILSNGNGAAAKLAANLRRDADETTWDIRLSAGMDF